jgi:AMIN domain-containing protein
MVGKKLLLAFIAACSLSDPSVIQAEEALPVIKGIRVIRTGDTVGVEISADRNLEYTCYKMPQLLKVVVDLPMTEPGRPDTVFKVESTMISAIKLRKKSINDVMVTRIAVDLIEDADFVAQSDPSDRKKVTVFLRKAALPSPAGATTASRDEAGIPTPPPGKNPVAHVASRPPPAAQGAVRPATVSQVNFGADAIEIRIVGIIGAFKTLSLGNPQRLVIDIPGAESTIRSISVPPNNFGILKARIGSREGTMRLVFDAGQTPLPDHDVLQTESGLKVLFRPAAPGRK